MEKDRKKEYIEKIQAQFDHLVRMQDHINLHGGVTKFYDWAGTVGDKFDTRGCKHSNISTIRNEMASRLGSPEAYDEGSEWVLKSSAWALLLDRYEVLVNGYTNTKLGFKTAFERPALKGYYNVYFFYLEKEKEPAIGRGILHVMSPNDVIFKNLDDGRSKSYKGSIHGTDHGVVVLRLRSETGDKTTHIKLYSKTPEHALCLGAFITYEFGHIVTGDLVIEPIQAYEQEKHKPAILSVLNKENPPKESIINYLSSKKFNYKRLKRNIHNETLLKEFIDGAYEENWQHRFIETGPPTVYIAFPNASLGQDDFSALSNAVSALQHTIESRFPGKLNIVHRLKKYTSEASRKADKPPSIRTIERTRFFILIHTPTEKASFGLVQLGHAINHCKHVMLFYERGSVSSNIERLNTLGVEKYAFGSLEEALKGTILDKIIERIELSLPYDYLYDAGNQE